MSLGTHTPNTRMTVVVSGGPSSEAGAYGGILGGERRGAEAVARSFGRDAQGGLYEESKVEHRTAGPTSIRGSGETGRVPALLLTSRDALREASRPIASHGVRETEYPSVAFLRALTALRRESEDATSTALAQAPDEGDRRAVLTALYVRGDTGRIVTLIEQIGDIFLGRGGQPFGEPLAAHLRELLGACLTLTGQAHDVVCLSGPPSLLGQSLTGIADRQRRLSGLLLTGGLGGTARDAVDAAVLGRCYEECAWRAAALAHVGLVGREGLPRRR